jgi:hypothetical protein
MVWSMKVIATAKIIAVRTRLCERPPAPAVVLALITFSPFGFGSSRISVSAARWLHVIS